MTLLRRCPLVVVIVALCGAARASAECASLYESCNDLASISANGGSVAGTVTFAPGVNENAATWGPTGHVTYFGRNFRAAAGSITLWYKRTSAATSGGICQIGTVSQPNSIGLFYSGGDDLGFEMRSSGGDLGQVFVQDALPLGVWTHIAAAWHEQDGRCDMWISINGSFRGYAALAGTLSHNVAPFQVGTTGYYGHGEGSTDELRWFEWDLLDSEVYAEYVYSSNRHRPQATAKPVSTGPVQLVAQHLYVNGAPFTVKGVGYAPTPIGSNPDFPTYTDPGIIARDVPALRAMNVNTVRTWAQPPNSMLLNALYNGGENPIYMIVGFWVPTSGIDYADPGTLAYYEAQFRNLVLQFKDHPGVLAWGLGNEVNLSLSGQALTNWYVMANHLAEVAYLAEGPAYHPTIVVNGGLLGLGNVDCHSDDQALNYVDMWGHNTYFGWDAHCYFDYYARLSTKPLVFTEYGIDAWNNAAGVEYPDVQAMWNVRQWRQIRSACLGGTVMAWSDEWWKAGDPGSHDYGGYATRTHPDGFSNEEFWGLVAVQDNPNGPDLLLPRQAYYALGTEYAYALGDWDSDGDVDLADYAALQQCVGAVDGLCATVFDYAVNDYINGADLARFTAALNGPDQPPAP